MGTWAKTDVEPHPASREKTVNLKIKEALVLMNLKYRYLSYPYSPSLLLEKDVITRFILTQKRLFVKWNLQGEMPKTMNFG